MSRCPRLELPTVNLPSDLVCPPPDLTCDEWTLTGRRHGSTAGGSGSLSPTQADLLPLPRHPLPGIVGGGQHAQWRSQPRRGHLRAEPQPPDVRGTRLCSVPEAPSGYRDMTVRQICLVPIVSPSPSTTVPQEREKKPWNATAVAGSPPLSPTGVRKK